MPQVSALAARHILADNALTFFSLLAVNVSSWTSSPSLSGPLMFALLFFFSLSSAFHAARSNAALKHHKHKRRQKCQQTNRKCVSAIEEADSDFSGTAE